MAIRKMIGPDDDTLDVIIEALQRTKRMGGSAYLESLSMEADIDGPLAGRLTFVVYNWAGFGELSARDVTPPALPAPRRRLAR